MSDGYADLVSNAQAGWYPFVVLALLSCIWCAYLLKFTLLDKNMLTHQWLAHHTILILRNWLDWNPIHYFFGLLTEPASIEANGLANRVVYTSYPPGFVLIPYMYCKLFHVYPTIRFIEIYSSINQFVTALVIGATFLNLFRKESVQTRMVAFFIAFSCYMFLFEPSVHNYYSYLADMAVLLPVAYLCWFMTGKHLWTGFALWPKRVFLFASSLIFLFGGLTDPFFYVMAVCLLGVNLFMSMYGKPEHWPAQLLSFREILVVAIPCVVAVSLYVAQIAALGRIGETLGKLKWRVGMVKNDQYNPPFSNFLQHFYKPDLVLFGLLFLYSLARFRKFALVIFFACALQIFCFSQHSKIHSFTTVKFSMFAAFALPYIYIDLKKHFHRKMFVLVVLAYLSLTQFMATVDIARADQVDVSYVRMANRVAQIAKHNDIFISNFYDINVFPPHLMTVSKKHVWRTETRQQLAVRVKGLDPNSYNIIAVIPFLTDYLASQKDEPNSSISKVDSYNPFNAPIPWFYEIHFKPETDVDMAFSYITK
jgi:hypothetical protein